MFLPIQIQMDNRKCLVVGGSVVAARKCSKLVEYGALVTAVAPFFSDDPLWQSPQVNTIQAPYSSGLLDGMFLVIAATDDKGLNRTIVEDAAEKGVLAQQVDLSDAGDFIMPATLRRGGLTVSFSTNGINPAYSRLLRDQAEGSFDESYTNLTDMMAELRNGPAWQKLTRQQRKQGLRRMAQSAEKVLFLLRNGHAEKGRMLLEAAAGIGNKPTPETGIVSLVGAGAGDPALITVKGAKRLQEAEVVLYDSYANRLLLEQYAPFAEHIDVGKHKGGISPTQEEINRLLLAKAREGATVVRLKGGDPLLFGRGGEEARMLAENNIPFEIIPGVSSALAVPAYSGIPVTDRDFASSVGFYSLHKKNGALLSDTEWQRMAQGPDTLVLLMGSTVLHEIAENLIRHGRPPSTPVALITKGTHQSQTRYLGKLSTIAGLAAKHRIERPGLVVVGMVAGVVPAMDWFPCLTVWDEA